MKLPIELLENIVDLLVAEYDKGYGDSYHRVPDTVKACSLASRLFLPSTRRLIFGQSRSLNFLKYRLGQQDRVNQFNQLLEKNPDIAHYVRYISYRIHESDFGNTQLQRLFTQLSLITHLHLFKARDKRHFRWDFIPRHHISILESLIRLPNLKSLALEGFRAFPAQLLASTTQLEKLVLCDMSFSPESFLTVPHSKCRLQELVIERSDLAYINMLFIGTHDCPPAVDITNLAVITFRLNHMSSIDNINTIFRVAGQSLTNVSITNVGFSLFNLGLKFLRDLQTIQIISIHFDKNEDPLYGFADLLAASDGHFYQHLRAISIDIDIRLTGLADEPFSSWQLLDTILTRNLFPELETVVFSVTLCQLAAVSPQSMISALLARHFPSLSHPNANIKFDFKTDVMPL